MGQYYFLSYRAFGNLIKVNNKINIYISNPILAGINASCENYEWLQGRFVARQPLTAVNGFVRLKCHKGDLHNSVVASVTR